MGSDFLHGTFGLRRRRRSRPRSADREQPREPNNTYALMKQGSTYLEQGKFSRAVQEYRRALGSIPP